MTLPLSQTFSELEHELLAFFAKHKELYLVNLGTIKAVYNSAIIYRHKITAPFYSLIWLGDEQAVNGQILLQRLEKEVAANLNLKKNDTTKLIEDYSSIVKENLDKHQLHNIKKSIAIRLFNGVWYLQYTPKDIMPSFQELEKSPPLPTPPPSLNAPVPPHRIQLNKRTSYPTNKKATVVQSKKSIALSAKKITPTIRHNQKTPQPSVLPKTPIQPRRQLKATTKKKTPYYKLVLYSALIAVLAIAILIIIISIINRETRAVSPLGSLY